jgi:outer membrane protein assembly factor BamB
MNSYASPTPVIDGDRIYCHFGTYGTVCLDRSDLSVVWKRRLPLVHAVGPGSSPFIHGESLILICDGVDRQYVAALDKSSGKTVWERDRPPMEAPSGDMKKAYCTPIAIVDAAGREQVICMGSQWIVAYEPKTGEEIWKVYHGKGFSVVPRPVYADGIVYFSTGFGKPQLWAVRVDGSGDVTETHVAWTETRRIPARPSPLLAGELLFVVSDDGIASCFDARSGETKWSERIGGNFSASPLLADGKLYFCNHEGKTVILRPSGSFAELASNQLDGQIMASPVAVANSLLIRTDKGLYRIQESAQIAAQ